MTNQANDTASGAANDESGNNAVGRLHGAASAVKDAAAAARATASDTLAAAGEKVSGVVGTAKDKSAAAYSSARDTTAAAYSSARETTAEAYEAARDTAARAKTATAEGIEDNPLAALVGGIALGVLVGALLPRTRREEETLGPIAAKLTETAKAAATAAAEAGRQTLDEMGVNSENARGQVEKLVDTAVKAATSASTAAADAVRHP
jgi:ElaB/YqjD/DUF883 family membrane-anchored ribosome-binding protein